MSGFSFILYERITYLCIEIWIFEYHVSCLRGMAKNIGVGVGVGTEM